MEINIIPLFYPSEHVVFAHLVVHCDEPQMAHEVNEKLIQVLAALGQDSDNGQPAILIETLEEMVEILTKARAEVRAYFNATHSSALEQVFFWVETNPDGCLVREYVPSSIPVFPHDASPNGDTGDNPPNGLQYVDTIVEESNLFNFVTNELNTLRHMALAMENLRRALPL